MSKGRWEVHDFIKQHKHIHYCEACINPDGTVEYIYPNHFNFFFLKATGIDIREYESKSLEEWDSVVDKYVAVNTPHYIDALCERSGCVALWYNMAVIPTNATKKQEYVLQMLEAHKIVDFQDTSNHRMCINRAHLKPGRRIVDLKDAVYLK